MGDITVHIMPEWQNMLLQLISTALLFLVFRWKLFTPIKNLLAKRADGIKTDIKVASDEKIEAENLKRSYEDSLSNAKDEARTIVGDAKKRGDQLKDEIVAEAKEEAGRLKEKSLQDVQREKEKALDSLKTEVAAMAISVAGKVVDKTLDESAHKEMIDGFINEVGEEQWQN